MRRNTLGSFVASLVKVVQIVLYVFIAIYAFAGWTFAGELITLKSVILLVLAGTLLQRAAALIPSTPRVRSRPTRFALASL
ncbi:MAG TPA: hypothetical protein VD997_04045 [Phycisphaerales bacterium]|nr:hypothetical protein [Phycisphaerales bacterium]